jgi:hypothetical protein
LIFEKVCIKVKAKKNPDFIERQVVFKAKFAYIKHALKLKMSMFGGTKLVKMQL